MSFRIVNTILLNAIVIDTTTAFGWMTLCIKNFKNTSAQLLKTAILVIAMAPFSKWKIIITRLRYFEMLHYSGKFNTL